MKILILLFLVVHISNSFACNTCQISVKAVAKFVELIIPKFIAVEGLEALCMRRYDSQKLCKKVGQQIAPLAIDNFIKNHLSSDKKCSQLCGNTFVKYYAQKQEQRILTGQPLKQINLTKFIKLNQFTIEPKRLLNVLHLSDIHEDKNYVEKSSVNCQLPICCHAQNGFPQNPGAQAKPFGNKNCDSPPQLLNSFLKFVGEQKIDIILATGDFVAHNQWEKTNQSIRQTQQQVQNKIKKTFPNAILIKSEGNNDYLPDHQFDASKTPKLVQITQIQTGQTKFTFVSLNTIAFDQMNLYLLGDQSYAIFQLMILQQILQQKNNVYLLGHIPTTMDGTAKEYATVFRALVAKYSKNIKGQFYGHVHSDQLAVNTNPKTQTPTGFSFIAPSISPLHVGSSRARIYKLLSGQKNGVNDYTQYHIKDLASQTPQWLLQYRFREKYHLIQQQQTPITAQQVEQIKKKIFADKNEQVKYLKTTGLQKQFGKTSYCNMLDDPQLRSKCKNRSQNFNDKIYSLLDRLRGQWGYIKKQMY